MAKPTTVRFTVEDDDGEEHVHELPARWEVCGRCDGEGAHVNPSVDGLYKLWLDDQEDDRRYRALVASELRHGC